MDEALDVGGVVAVAVSERVAMARRGRDRRKARRRYRRRAYPRSVAGEPTMPRRRGFVTLSGVTPDA